MNVTQIVPASGSNPPQSNPRVKMERTKVPVQSLPKPVMNVEQQISAAELVEKIKEIAQDGQYSVRFEMNNDVNRMIIKVVSQESGEIVRTIPSEELIHISKTLRDLRGLMVDTAS